MYPQKLTSTSESSTSAHPGPTPVGLSESPVMSLPPSKPLTTVKNTTKIGTIVSHLANMATVNPKLTISANVSEQPSNHMIRRALPGMVAPERAGATAAFLDETLQEKDSVSNEEAKPSSVVLSVERPLIPIPSRHSKIPSTGNRATVMDVVQVLNTQSPEPEPASEAQPRSLMPAAANQLRNLTLSVVHMEKRKSSQEKYSAIILPPLKEETTPTASPAGTLSHATSNIHRQKLIDEVSEKPGLLVKANNIGKGNVLRTSACFHMVFLSKAFNADDGNVLRPSVNIESLVKPPALFSADLNSETISVDMMLVTGTTATAIPQNRAIFYDTELLAIVHRSKSRTTSLVSTTIWAWRGKRCTPGEKENKKIQELANRYGTSAVRLF